MKQSRILVLALLALAAWSCGRKSTTPSSVLNHSPVTVLVAAPYDTSFLKTPQGGIPTAVVYRYHAHWYGSDPDGKVVGYYVIVTDTNGVPGLTDFYNPKYFTTRTDSIFTFTVTPTSPRYPHTLWVAAVDDQGKSDFNPAHVILNAEDRYLPEPVVDAAYAIIPGGRQVWLTDSERDPSHSPRDTIPLGSYVHFRWHVAPPRDPHQAPVVGFKVRIGSTEVFTTDTSVTYLADQLQSGRNEFHLKGVDAVNGETGSGGAPDTLRVFAYNYAPGTWFTDPNTLALPPELRPIQRRFYELRDGKVIPHADGDTISRTSDIRLAFGGWDRDGQVRGFSVEFRNSLVGGGGLQPTPTATTPPSGSIEVFEPFLNQPYEFSTDLERHKAGVRSFLVRAFDYQGQVDPTGARITVVSGFRPYFKVGDVTQCAFLVNGQPLHDKSGRTRIPFDPSFPGDTLLVDSSVAPVYIAANPTSFSVRAVAYDGNDLTGSTPITSPGAFNLALDPETASPTTYDQVTPSNVTGVTFPFWVPDPTDPTATRYIQIRTGLHVIEVTANDYLSSEGQDLGAGRIAKLRIPFYFKRKR